MKKSLFTLSFLMSLVAMNAEAQNLALTATAAHSGGGATIYDASNYNDNNISNCGSTPWGWVSTNGWIEYTWATPQTLTKVIFYKDNRPMTTCTIEAWNGSSYTTVATYNSSVTCLDSITFSAVTTTKLRFNSVAGSSNPNHREIQVYGITCSTSITKQPVGKTICEGQNVAFGVVADDVAKYQWQVDEGNGFNDLADGGIYTGANSDSLKIANAPFNISGQKYRCLVSKSICADTSDEVSLVVNGLVKLVDMKSKDTTCISATKDIEVKGDGSIVNYRWQIFINGQGYVDLPIQPPYSQTGNVLHINGVPDTLDGGRFRCIVDGICDTVTSNEVQLTVALIPYVAVPPADVIANHGQTVQFEVQATAPGARYYWQVAATNDTFVYVNDGGIYSGARTNRLTVKGVTKVQTDFKFRCIVSSSIGCNAPGDTSNFAVLTVSPPAGVGSLGAKDVVLLYPNPVSGSDLFIKISGALAVEHLSYRVVDKTGRTVILGEIKSNSGDISVDVNRLAADVYILELRDESGTLQFAERFTKM